MFEATSFCRALNRSMYLSSCPAMGCSTALDLVQPVGQTISHLKSVDGSKSSGKILARRHIPGTRRRNRPLDRASGLKSRIADNLPRAGPGFPERDRRTKVVIQARI